MQITRSLSIFSLLVTWLVSFTLAYPIVFPDSRAVRVPRDQIDSVNSGALLSRRVDAPDDLETRGFKKKVLAPVKKALKKLNPAKFLRARPVHSSETGFDRTAYGGVSWRPAQGHAVAPPSPHSSVHTDNVVYGIAYEPRPLPIAPQAQAPPHVAERPAEEAGPASRVKGPRPKPWLAGAQ
ncbi:hypothetical protein HYPSUDRAFT_218209 [Hypholoma sublateritium FD-334 SS-4]|uniref:Uncharacterized protein n=1 Tax=Hypholoma sublateritium (strain FD-334 SS-4) TaxID=945553 RepID=A0A0D2PDU6_HYPSF|nr:hypothetical protein HYPSUDRAFT_218209 [Hypholoma sublateritium FD-334 SS-4]